MFFRLRWSLSGNGSGPPWNRTGYFTYENKYRTAFDIDTRKRTGYYRICIRLPARLAVGDLLGRLYYVERHYGGRMKSILKWTGALLCEAIAALFFVGTFCALTIYDWAAAMFAAGSCALFGIAGYVIER